MIRLVLFDIDGTLISTGGAGVMAFERTAKTEFGVEQGTGGLQFAGRTDPSIVRDFFVRHGIEASAGNFRRFVDCYVFWLDHLLEKLNGRALGGVGKLIHDLESLPQAPVLGLLTGNIRLGAEIKLRFYALWERFQIGAFGDDHEDRNQLGRIAQRRGSRWLGDNLRGEEMLVIGDTPRDIECAQAINARVLAVASGGYPLDQLQAHQPTWAAPDLEGVDAAAICV